MNWRSPKIFGVFVSLLVVLAFFINPKIALLVALASIGFLAYFIYQKKYFDDSAGNPLNPQAIAQRRENLNKIMRLAESSPRLTNEAVQIYLDVSDATATRYLNYLVSLGKLTRVNDRGREVYYEVASIEKQV